MSAVTFKGMKIISQKEISPYGTVLHNEVPYRFLQLAFKYLPLLILKNNVTWNVRIVTYNETYIFMVFSLVLSSFNLS